WKGFPEEPFQRLECIVREAFYRCKLFLERSFVSVKPRLAGYETLEYGGDRGLSINLEGKVALVTGASSGLGARFAEVLAAAGDKVILASRRVERLKELRADIESRGGSAHVVRLDVSDPESIN